MSFLKNLRSAFSQKNAQETPESAGQVADGNTSSESGTQPVSAAQPLPIAKGTSNDEALNDSRPAADNVVNIYSHGFTNGVYRVEPDGTAFERFLEFCNESDRLREQRALNRSEISRVRQRLDVERADYSVDRDLVVEKGKQAERLNTSMEELTGMRKRMEEKEAVLVMRQRETVAEYAWVPALLFLMAGGTFIAADISITKQITSWGFNMTGVQGWIYAVGLAFTAFLIKPVIDRMLEKPYVAAGLKLKVIYKCVLIGITLAGLVMLWFLGRFRADSERAGMNLRALTERMAVIDPTTTDYAKLQSEYDEVERGLDENSMGQNGLVLSGLLFAVGGAICLTVSFGSLKQLINRYWILPVRIGQMRRGLQAIGKRLDGIRAEQAGMLGERDKAESRLAASELTSLREELDRLHAEELALLAAFYQAQSERERALYRDGRSRGEKFQLDGDLVYRVPGNDGARLQLGNGQEAGGMSGAPRAYTRRPFVKMRKMIADQFNKNKNNQPYDDGTEFEIVS